MNSKNINKAKLYIADSIIFVLCVILDIVTKYVAIYKLKDHPSVSVISAVLELRYLENVGAAFGLLKNQKYFFILVASIVFLVGLYVIIKSPGKKKYVWLNILVILIMAGATGNTIDRLLYGYVVDFIYFSIIDFPIFNVADIFVTTSSVMLVALLVFYYKEDDLNFLKLMEKKIRDVN